MKKHVFIIAEAGVNHNGDIKIAKELILAAKKAGADAVKFQMFHANKLVTKLAEQADYQKGTSSADNQYDMLEKLELSNKEFDLLSNYCKEIGIIFMSTAFDLESLKQLETLGVHAHKIPSGEITNLPYLEAIAKTQKPIIMSTGMCELKEVKEAIAVIRQYSSASIQILHCNTEYPTPYTDVNLRAMVSMKDELALEIGYSDHTEGIEVCVAAVALGATVIEKHFTLDKNMEGPDHKASLNPVELTKMIEQIRNIESALGDRDKKVSKSERKNIDIARKSIVANRKINKGDILNIDNLTTKRPGNGISPMNWYSVIGTKAVKDFDEDELIVI